MTGVQVLDLSGCSLDAVLYYVNQDIPVLAILEDGEAVLVTGFNEFNVVIMEPSTGKLYKKGNERCYNMVRGERQSFYFLYENR